MRYLLAAFLGAHGVAHLVGFVSSWRLATLAEMPYKTTILGGRLDLGDTGIRVMGLSWLLAAVSFVIDGVGIATGAAWAWRLMAIAAAVSLLLSLAAWPDARIGVFVNLILLVILVAFGPALRAQ